MVLIKQNGQAGLDSSVLEYEATYGYPEHGTDASGTIKLGKLHD
jgi:hypothetical protein